MAVFLSPCSPPWCALALGSLLLLAPVALAESLSNRLLAEVRDGRLDELDLVAAALIAGGTHDECELTGWLDSYSERRSRVLREISELPAADRLAAIHSALHERLLTGEYQIAASDPRRTLSTGDYNCLSSLVVYLDLCRKADLELEIWLVRGHVYLRANMDDSSTVIEPGAPQWSSRSVVRRTNGRQITPVELLGKFYYNRGVELLRDRQYAEGMELLKTSLALDPADDDARANLVAGLNNWAVEHCRAARYDAAAALIEQGLSLDPDFAPLVANEQLVRAKLGR
jgi:tetratricopeptide (TPR) repeat protein